MKTKFTLTIDGVEHELSASGIDECLMNWADVICAYKRSDYNGIVRSFTSKFDFVGKAYNLLLDAFLQDRYDAKAKLAVYTYDDDWSWQKRFDCDLDFSTKSISNGVFTIGAIDNSLGAIIKAHKSTKYEMLVGEDVRTGGKFRFERLPMSENVTFGLTQGETDEDTGALLVQYIPPEDESQTMWIGKIAEEICVGGTILWSDAQENDKNGYVIEAFKNTSVEINSSIVVDVRHDGELSMDIVLVRVGSDGAEIGRLTLAKVGGSAPNLLGTYETAEQLRNDHPSSDYPSSADDYDSSGICAIISSTDTVYYLKYMGDGCVWATSGKSPEEFFSVEHSVQRTVLMRQGEKLRIIGGDAACTFMAKSSRFNFKWIAIGEQCDIDIIKPKELATSLMNRMTDGKVNVNIEFSEYDSRLSNTVILAAESVRGMENARIYSSFAEFCDWMSTVFGYTYYLCGVRESQFTQPPKEAALYEFSPVVNLGDTWQGDVDIRRIIFMGYYGMFMYRAENYTYYRFWDGWEEYNTPIGSARKDTLYLIGGNYYYFVEENDRIVMAQYYGNPFVANKEIQDLRFVHRSELFHRDMAVKVIDSVKDVSNSTVSSQIFSAVEIGYEKKDYDQINGRDEWNFDVTYSTGCDISDKKLTLKSKYRCDCYGIEFTAQKRGKETTDSDSDNDVFFVHCSPLAGACYYADRITFRVLGALSDMVFNGAYSPSNCVRANAGYIGMQSRPLTLKYTSSTGNSDILIGGVSVSSDVTIDNPLMMSESLEFTTDDDNIPSDINGLVRVTDNGIVYTGYISEIEMKFTKETAIKYKLLLKDITLCS